MDEQILRLVTLFNGYGIALYTFITMAIAATLTFFIGFEREHIDGHAGLLQHILIAISCSLLMTLSIWAIRTADGSIDIFHGGPYSGTETDGLNYDTSRIAAAVVTGVGFLGAGAIIKNGWTVKGLSSAATMWLSAAIGLSCGAGFILEAIIASAVTMLLLLLVPVFIRRYEHRLPSIKIKYKKSIPFLDKIHEVASANNVAIRRIKTIEEEGEYLTVIIIFSSRTDRAYIYSVAADLQRASEIVELSF